MPDCVCEIDCSGDRTDDYGKSVDGLSLTFGCLLKNGC